VQLDLAVGEAMVDRFQVFIDPDRQNVRQGEHLVALDIAEMFGRWFVRY
jgi:hypothetical protein